jgi:uncharacterized membrane protein YfcA
MIAAITEALATLTTWQYAAAFVVVAFAAVVQYRTGVGFGLFAAPLVALAAPQFVPVPIIGLTLVTATIAMAGTWRGIVWPELGWSISGRTIGAFAAIVILAQLTGQRQFMLVFGVLVLLAVAMSLAGFRFRFSGRLLFIMGAVSGFTATITSVGGPPMAIAYQDQKPDHARPNMSAFFAIGCVVVLLVRQINGLNKVADFVNSVLLLPALGVGVLAAPLFKGLIDSNFRTMLLIVCALSSLLLIARALL